MESAGRDTGGGQRDGRSEGLWTGNQPQSPDIGGWGNHEYGNRVGILRILAVVDKYCITPTLALDKAVADHPTLVKEGRAAAPSSSRTGCRAAYHPYRHVRR